jgi:hypothetical protein
MLASIEWDDDGRRQRAELLTLLPGHTVSTTDVLHQAIDLPSHWWTALRHSLNRLHTTPTRRVYADQVTISRRSQTTIGADVRVQQWETVHGDLHWANLLAPQFGLVDWELWGRGPAGTDAASLYCHSLLVPAVADRVRTTFTDELDTPTGRIAQLAVATRMLGRIDGGDYPELEAPLRRLVATLVTTG